MRFLALFFLSFSIASSAQIKQDYTDAISIDGRLPDTKKTTEHKPQTSSSLVTRKEKDFAPSLDIDNQPTNYQILSDQDPVREGGSRVLPRDSLYKSQRKGPNPLLLRRSYTSSKPSPFKKLEESLRNSNRPGQYSLNIDKETNYATIGVPFGNEGLIMNHKFPVRPISKNERWEGARGKFKVDINKSENLATVYRQVSPKRILKYKIPITSAGKNFDEWRGSNRHGWDVSLKESDGYVTLGEPFGNEGLIMNHRIPVKSVSENAGS